MWGTKLFFWQIKYHILLVWYFWSLFCGGVWFWTLVSNISCYVVFYFERLGSNFDTSVLNQAIESKLGDLCPIFDTSVQIGQ